MHLWTSMDIYIYIWDYMHTIDTQHTDTRCQAHACPRQGRDRVQQDPTRAHRSHAHTLPKRHGGDLAGNRCRQTFLLRLVARRAAVSSWSPSDSSVTVLTAAAVLHAGCRGAAERGRCGDNLSSIINPGAALFVRAVIAGELSVVILVSQCVYVS